MVAAIPNESWPERRVGVRASVGLFLAVLAFALNYSIERRLDGLGAFETYNTIFRADANSRLMSFSYGYSYNRGGRNFAHPNLTNFVNPVVRAVAKVLHVSGIKNGDISETRRSVGLLVAPVASAVKALAVFALFAFLGLPGVQVVLITALSIVSFSQVIYGSVPDHFVLSGLGIALAYLLALDLVRRKGKIRWVMWTAVGTLVMGFTITNIAIVALLMWGSLLGVGQKVVSATGATAVLVGLVSVVTLGAAIGLNKVYEEKYQMRPETMTQSQKWAEKFVRHDALARLAHYPSAVANTFSPPKPKTLDNPVKEKGARHTYYFTFEGTASVMSFRNVLGLVILIVIVAGSIQWFRMGNSLRWVGITSLLILAYNAVFHSVWGAGLFLYSQHWQLSALVLASGILLTKERHQRMLTFATAVVVAAVGINSALRLNDVFATLSGTA